MKLNDTHHHQCVDEIEVSFYFINTLMVVCIFQFHQHTDGGVYHSISSTHWWWCVQFNFINSLMMVSTISELMKLNDTHHHQWLNEIEWHIPPSVCWWNCMTHTTISVVNKLGVHHPISLTHWWWSMSHTFINTLMVECVIQFHYHTDNGVCHLISLTHWWWCVSFNFINTLTVECFIQFIGWCTPQSVCWCN
jgi:hypothetical protein